MCKIEISPKWNNLLTHTVQQFIPALVNEATVAYPNGDNGGGGAGRVAAETS